MRKTTLTALALLTAGLSASAQRMMGVSTGNWAGTNALYLNPANIADSRERFAIDLFSFNALADNTLGKINLSDAFRTSSTGSGVFNYANNDKFSMLFPSLEARLPGVMVSIDEKNSFAFTTRVRAINQFNNFDKSLYRLITDPPSTGGTPYNIQSQNFNWTLHAWTELRLSYARVVYNEGEHFVKAGITIGRLGGLGYMGVGGDIDAQFYPDNDSLVSTNTDIHINTNLIDSVDQLSGGVSDAFSQFFGNKGGSGWGGDIGVVYEYRPEDENCDDHAANKYKLRGSVALTDVGSIRYKNSRGARILGNGSMSSGDLSDNFGDYNSFADYANSRGYYLTDTAVTTRNMKLPTALVIGADYHAVSHLYVNGTFILNMVNRNSLSNSYFNTLTITPRWDTKWFSAGLPITYNTMTGVKMGLGFRAGGFFFGSDDMLVFLSGAHYGANFYIGGFVPIYKKHRRSQGAAASSGS